MDRERCRAVGFDIDAFLETEPSSSYDNQKATNLYVIGCGQYVKVGIAVDIDKRLAGFQIGNPFPITLLREAAFKSRLHALLVERTIHQVLADERHYGEWFVCKPERATEVAALVTQAMRLLEVEFRRKELARRQKWQERYESDPAFRAKLDAQRAESEHNYQMWKDRDKAIGRATAEFDAAHRESHPVIQEVEDFVSDMMARDLIRDARKRRAATEGIGE